MTRAIVHSPLLCSAVLLASYGAVQPVAEACSLSPCRAAVVFPAQGAVPADLFTLQYQPPRGTGGVAGPLAPTAPQDGVVPPRLYRLDGDARVEVPCKLEPAPNLRGVYTVVPQQALAAGTRIVLESDAPACAADKRLAAEFTITEARTRPSALGTLEASVQRGTLRAAAHASCSDEFDAVFADFQVALASEVQPFADVIRYELVLDGVVQPSFADSLSTTPENRGPIAGSLLGRGRDRVFAVCEPERTIGRPFLATPEGMHRARMRAVLPDQTTLETPELEFALDCGPSSPAPDSTATDAGSTPESSRASSTGLATVSDVAADDESSASSDADAARMEADEGCAALPGRSATSLSTLALVGLALAWLRRRRSARP